MNRKIKITISVLCILGTILIITGLGLTLKSLMHDEYMLNVADDPAYFRAVLNLNGATSIENKIIKCKINNKVCSITLPNAIKKDGTVLGYSDNKNDTVAKYKINEVINLDQNIELYVISYKTNTLIIDNNDVDFLEKNEVSCDVYNENKACTVIIPNFNKIGYENRGYSTTKESLVGFKFPYDEYEISKDTVIYPLYGTNSRHKSINILKKFTYRDSFIEVEKGCKEDIYNSYLNYLDDISKHAPFLLLGNKISFLTDKSFDDVWGNNYVGMNYGPKNFRSVDLRCGNKLYNDNYATLVHEMAHSWDFYYANRMGNNISSQSDVINLYNKYKNSNTKPFREYSYSSLYEFLADMMRYYYLKYYVPRSGFSNLDYPQDIKRVLEKYICISNNNYDESRCK